MRTEFLVVGRATMPDEEEQYRAYRRVSRRSAASRW
jgi:phosphotransferase system enzyme I (PtsI)